MRPLWRIELLGTLRARRLDVAGFPEITHFRTRKAAELLAYLAMNRGRAHPREAICELLWPEEDPLQTRHRLSVALSALRAQFEPPGIPGGSVVLTDRWSVQFHPQTVITDVAELEELLAESGGLEPRRAARLEEALCRSPGELLSGFYSDWAQVEQRRFVEGFRRAASLLILWLEEREELERAVRCAHRLVALDPLVEDGHRTIMRLHARLGETELALRQYQELERLLRTELDSTPEPATRQLVVRIRENDTALRGPFPPSAPAVPTGGPSHAPRASLHVEPEPVGGAVPLGSPFYVERDTDARLHQALARTDTLVLLKGASQVGKTSLLIRGLHQARGAGRRAVFTSFQALNAAQIESPATLLLALCELLAEALDLPQGPGSAWTSGSGPNMNASRYLRRQVLAPEQPPLVWGLDEVDRLFDLPYGPEILGLFRSWHNERALEPDGPWSRLTLAMTYATEAHLHLSDLNQSPFNVGTRLTLGDFTPAQVTELCGRYAGSLDASTAAVRLPALVGGHPYLLRRALHEIAYRGVPLEVVEQQALSPEGVFSDHLRRLLGHLAADPALGDAVRAVLSGDRHPEEDSFYRLRTAGVLSGESDREARFRCPLYEGYLQRHWPEARAPAARESDQSLTRMRRF